MPLSLHAALIPAWIRTLGAVRHFVDKAETHCNEHGRSPADLLEARLAEDMLPLAYQFKSCWVHTHGAIEGVRNGRFSPDVSELPTSFAAIAARIDQTIGFLASVSPDELEQTTGKDVVFTIGESYRLVFTAENFLLGFSQPNFYFHATTAYDILRMKGLPLGKRDYLGAMPLKG